jgi:short-subunit dehydrogenase
MKKIILITGGASGLGKEISKILSDKNIVVILDIDIDKIKKMKKELGIEGYKCDITNPKEIEKTINLIIKKYKKIDVLINNAGIWIKGEIEKNKLEEILLVSNVNLAGAMMTTSKVVSFMKKKKSGFIINIISQSVNYSRVCRSVYSATKHGLAGFTKCLQVELPKYGIKLSNFYPGAMKTNFFKKYGNIKGKKNMMNPKIVANVIKMMIEFDEDIVFPEIGIKHYLR